MNLSLKKLKWLSILAPALFLGAFGFVLHYIFNKINFLLVNIAIFLLLGGGVYLFSHFIFSVIGKLQKNVEQRNRELSVINKIALYLGRSLNLDEILSTTIEELHKFFPDANMGLYIYHNNKLHLVEKRGQLYKEGNIIDLSSSAQDESLEGYTKAIKRGSLIVEKTKSSEYCLYSPLKSRKGLLGILLISRQRPFLSGELEALTTISNQLGFSIENSRLHSQVYELAIIEERERLAREVHDGLAQILGIVSLKSSIAQRLLSTGQITQAEFEIKEIEKVTQEAYVDAREMILGLRTYISEEGGIKKTLNEYIGKFKLTSGTKVELDIEEGMGLTFFPSVEIQLIRIIQEALSNVRKHANAGKAWVKFRSVDGHTYLTIEDNGQGFDISSLEQGDRLKYGLQTMKERAEKIGVTFKITSFPGLGTKVEIRLPVIKENGMRVESYESSSS